MTRRTTRFTPRTDSLEPRLFCSDLTADLLLLVTPVPLVAPAVYGAEGAATAYAVYLRFFADQSGGASSSPPPMPPGWTPMDPVPLP